MKYVISAIIYTILFSVVIGFVDLLMRGSFMDGFFPTNDGALFRWAIRGSVITYMTITRPFDGIK